MPSLREVFRRWLPLAAAIVPLSLLVYAAVQQAHRSGANDPQVQLAEDAARALEGGATPESVLPAAKVELEHGLAPFVILYDAQGKPVAGSGTLGGRLAAPPQGVFDFARANGEERVTWQPERGVRIASVVRRSTSAAAAFVLAGRSMREVEEREANLRRMSALALLGALSASFLVAALSEAVLGART
jgi:hypothetical protein